MYCQRLGHQGFPIVQQDDEGYLYCELCLEAPTAPYAEESIMEHNEKVEFRTIDDARTYYCNSGMLDWEWFNEFDEDEFIEHLWRKANGYNTLDEILYEFLIRHGEEPRDYGIVMNLCVVCSGGGEISAASHRVSGDWLCDDCYAEYEARADED